MRNIVSFLLSVSILSSCSDGKIHSRNDFVIAKGQMPNLARDASGTIHLIYGSGDSILYCYSSDNANTFSKPLLISVLPQLCASATRGPQIATTRKGILVTACTSSGNIYSFFKEGNSNWIKTGKINDADTTAKEGLMALSAADNNAYAVWLDLRGNKHNKIYGARSADGGKTWSENILVYSSPDSSVCECCKPAIVVKGNKVYVMLRNWLKGNRDLYIVQSDDAGTAFGMAQKLGTGNWKLDGCPMDGGALAVNNAGEIETVWRREKNVYAAKPGMPEREIGEGKSCTLETINGKKVYAWTENGEVVILKPQGQKVRLGKGMLPVLKAINKEHVICVWERNKEIYASVVEL